MKRIHLLTLSPLRTFIPYMYGQMRSFCEQFTEIKDSYTWDEPTFLPDQIKQVDSLVKDPDVFGAQCFIWNFGQNMKICRQIKEKYPSCLMVIGGHNIPKDTTGFFEKYPFIDLIVHGEGETAFSGILKENLNSKPDWTKISGLSVRDGTHTIRTGPIVRMYPEIYSPSPFKAGFYEKSINLLHSIGMPPTVIWETNRGCPFECAYCASSSVVVGTKDVRMFRGDRLKDDIEYFGYCNASALFIADSNFGLFPRDLEIAQELAKQKEKCGNPKTIRTAFSARTNELVFEISKVFHQAKMLWATTQAVQSLNENTRNAIKREESIDNLENLITRYYKKDQIPIYTEIILGVPEETKSSFINGIGKLFRLGYQEDIRLYEFFVLPNTLVNTPEYQAQYGLRLAPIPLGLTIDSGVKEEWPHIIIETKSLPHEDWLYCYVFYEMIRGLHNGAYTRFISIYLEESKLASYEDFYTAMEDYFLGSPDTVLGSVLLRIKKLFVDYVTQSSIPHMHKIDSQTDMLEEIKKYVGKRKVCFPYRYLWLKLADDFDRFYLELEKFVFAKWPHFNTTEFRELLKFQKEIMLRPDYDPKIGKKCEYKYRWHDFFFNAKPLMKNYYQAIYKDQYMGPDARYPIVANNLMAFSKAAIGVPWPSSAHRNFFHQYDATEMLMG